jgi:CDP-paratose 2-epimerase
MTKTLLVTGSSGLIGSEVCAYFARELGYAVHGVDNNQRAVFFGPQGDTRWNQERLKRELGGFVHHELDIRDRAGVLALVGSSSPRRSSTPPPSRATTGRPRSRSTTSTPTPSAP